MNDVTPDKEEGEKIKIILEISMVFLVIKVVRPKGF